MARGDRSGQRGQPPSDAGGEYLAARLFWILDYLGHPAPALLDGGLAAWLAAGGPAATGGPEGFMGAVGSGAQPGDFVPLPEPGRIADFRYVFERLGRAEVRLCNALPEDSFRREAIPGSVSLPFRETFEPRVPYRLRAPDELEELLARRGPLTGGRDRGRSNPHGSRAWGRHPAPGGQRK